MAIESDISATAPASAAIAARGARSPFCRELRSKRYYFLEQMPTEEAHMRDASNRCWCRLTMQVIGPDGEMTQPQDCAADSGRTCYRSAFAE